MAYDPIDFGFLAPALMILLNIISVACWLCIAYFFFKTLVEIRKATAATAQELRAVRQVLEEMPVRAIETARVYRQPAERIPL